MKKIISSALGILLLAGLVSASFFYFSKNPVRSAENRAGKKSVAQSVDINSQNLEVQPPKESDLEAKPPSDIKLLFIGDMMFDRYIRQVGERRGYDFLFGDTDKILAGNDLVVGNLEGPITDNSSMSVGTEYGVKENYYFTFAPQVASVLKKHNIGLVSLGNNHILNKGKSGLDQTKKYLDGAGVKYFCDPNSPELRIANYELQNIKIAFVCYNQFEKGAVKKTLNDIETAKSQADVVILYAHWGKEYETTILRSIEENAHQFIDSGVDLIIGSHPHFIQEKEEYKGKIIYYSLGNFIFDQYFDPRTTEGLAVKVAIDGENKIKTEEIRLNLKNNGQTVINPHTKI